MVGTLATGFTSPYDITVDQNGDYFIVSSSSIWRLDSSNTMSTVVTGLASANGGTDIDINTGDLLVQSRTGTDPLWRISRMSSRSLAMSMLPCETQRFPNGNTG